MRLFVAVWPSANARTVLRDARKVGGAAELRWVAPENWHVTLLFLGTVPPPALSELVERLGDAARAAQPTTAVMGPRTTRLGRSVLCVPVSGLDPLAKAVRAAVPDRPADTPFRGHLTLARARNGRSIPAELLARPVTGSWPVRGFSLVRSTTASSGPRYQDLASFSLGR